ncbi:TetR/AcrR family transcriptional regulator [Humitalea sp. 24SJ18S-53]|uniref:TetR/AcrR family transcriptional regulator n=1 Tax=Humitalea sp. 24SJ18S-53 TaxID=3422307 RepID=UPI003D67D9B3
MAEQPTKAKPAPARPRRTDGEAREKAIVKAAIALFAEVGFGATTRDLADRLGMTQPLLYRYFASKDALIERVYEEVFVANWKPGWEGIIADRSRPLRERLTEFYLDYTHTVLTYEWIRLFMFSGLKGLGLNTRILRLIRRRIFDRVVQETRHAHGLPPATDVATRKRDVELVWGLHAAIFYIGLRRFVFGLKMPKDLDAVIADKVGAFLDGAPAVMAREQPPEA